MSRDGDNSVRVSAVSPEVRASVEAFHADASARRATGLTGDLVIRRWEDAPLVQEVFTLNNLMLRVADRLIARHGLTSARWMLIGALEQYDEPPTVSELSGDALLTVQNVSRMVRAMETEGWVERFTVPGRGRSVFVRLTARAERLCEEARAESEVFIGAFLDGVDSDEVALLRGLVDRMIGNLDRFERILQRHGAVGGSPGSRRSGSDG